MNENCHRYDHINAVVFDRRQVAASDLQEIDVSQSGAFLAGKLKVGWADVAGYNLVSSGRDGGGAETTVRSEFEDMIRRPDAS